MLIVGIDPGKGGAVAWRYDRQEPGVRPIPLVRSPNGKDEYDVLGLAELLRLLGSSTSAGVHVFIERQQALPATMGGVLANYNRGYGLGLFEGILATLGMPYQLVTPRRWQGVMLDGIPGEDTKQRTVIAAQRLFPGTSLLRTERSRKLDHGFADALLLCEWGWRQLSKGGA